MTADVKKVLDQVRKLRAKAEDPSVTEAEASAYAAKVAAILARHGLDMADVPEDERDDGIESHEWAADYAGDPWRRAIVFRAARLYFCEMIATEVLVTKTARKDRWTPYDGYVRKGEKYRDYDKGYILVGRPHNVEVCRSMCEYLIATTLRLAREYSPVRAAMLGFARGCGEHIADRLYDEWWKNQPRKSRPAASGGLPALYASESDLVTNWIEQNMQTHMTRTRGSDLSGADAAAGREAGDRVSLSPQVGSAGAGRLLS